MCLHTQDVILSDPKLGEGEPKDPFSLEKVRKAADSSTPLPAGSYAQNDNEESFFRVPSPRMPIEKKKPPLLGNVVKLSHIVIPKK